MNNAGIETVVIPCIKIAGVDSKQLLTFCKNIRLYDWLVLTSHSSIKPLVKAAKKTGTDLRKISAKIAVIGPSTAEAASSAGIKVSLISQKATSYSLAETLGKEHIICKRIMLLQGNLSGSGLEEKLVQAGAIVEKVVAYQTVEEVSDKKKLKYLFGENEIEAITLASGSAARAIFSVLGQDKFADLRYFCIGPTTAAVVESLGGRLVHVAAVYNVDGLVQIVVETLERERSCQVGNLKSSS